MTFSTRTTLAAGFIAFAAFLSACDAAPSEPFDTPVRADDRSSWTTTTTSAPRPHSSGPVVPAEDYVSTAPKIDYTEVIRYIESEARLAQYRAALDTVAQNMLDKMQQGEIPSVLDRVETTRKDPYGHEITTISEDEMVMKSLPDAAESTYTSGSENPRPAGRHWPRVSITYPLVDNKPDFSTPLTISATLTDGSTLSLQKVGEQSGIPFSGEACNVGLSETQLTVGAVTRVGDNPYDTFGDQTVIDRVIKSVPFVQIMNEQLNETQLTVDAIEMADRIILKKLQEVGELQGSDWY